MKKGIVVILGLAMVFCLSTFASAAQNVANTSQKGSLLIFPKIVVEEGVDTLILIGNDNKKSVDVKCVWVNAKQEVQNFGFVLTKRQSVKFSAKTGYGTVNVNPFPHKECGDCFRSWGGPPVGELKCWAVDEGYSRQISWNHLWGNAKIIDYEEGTAWEYNSWNFTARAPVDTGDPVGNGGYLNLDGKDNRDSYDACPKYLVFNFIPARTEINDVKFWDTDITVVPCKQDVREMDREPTYTALDIDVWNADEIPFSDRWVCIKCWYEEWISRISDNFWQKQLKTNVARARVKSRKSTDCDAWVAEKVEKYGWKPGTTVKTGLVGTVQELMKIYYEVDAVAVEAVEAIPGDQLPYRRFTAGTTMNGAGAATNGTAGFVRWDADDEGPVPTSVKK